MKLLSRSPSAALLLLCTLLSLPALAQEEDGRIKLAAPGLSGVNVSAEEAEFFNDYFSEKLSARGGIKITTASEVRAVLGLERQKQLLGCDEDSSCLTEIAGALGVDGIVIGSIARFGDSYGVNLKVIDATSSEKWAAVSGQVEAQKGVLTFLEDAAIRMAKEIKRSAGAPAPSETPVAANPRTRAAPESSAEEGTRALRQAAARHMIRLDFPVVSAGYEYRVLDFLRVGGRLRLSGLLSAHSSGAFAFGADGAALVRFEPFMTKPIGFSIHAGLSVGSHVWFGDDSDFQDAVGPILGLELIIGRVWRVGGELMLLPVIPGRPGTGGVISSLSFGRAFLF